MADLKSIANMQIGGPKYPKKRRINLYQKQTKKGKIAAELGVNRPLSSRQVKKERLRHEGLVPVSKGSQTL